MIDIKQIISGLQRISDLWFARTDDELYEARCVTQQKQPLSCTCARDSAITARNNTQNSSSACLCRVVSLLLCELVFDGLAVTGREDLRDVQGCTLKMRDGEKKSFVTLGCLVSAQK